MSAALSKCSQNKKNASAHVTSKICLTTSGKIPGERKTRLKKVTYLLTYLLKLSQLVSQNKICTFTCSAFYKFLEVQIMHIYVKRA